MFERRQGILPSVLVMTVTLVRASLRGSSRRDRFTLLSGAVAAGIT
jgi:hypothetical protein